MLALQQRPMGLEIEAPTPDMYENSEGGRAPGRRHSLSRFGYLAWWRMNWAHLPCTMSLPPHFTLGCAWERRLIKDANSYQFTGLALRKVLR